MLNHGLVMRDGSSCFDVDYDMPDYYLFKC
jgi:hypothetical protein